MAKIEELNNTIAELEGRLVRENDRVIDTITAHVDQALDDRAVGGESYGVARSIDHKLDSLIEHMHREFSERVRDVARYNEYHKSKPLCLAWRTDDVKYNFDLRYDST